MYRLYTSVSFLEQVTTTDRARIMGHLEAYFKSFSDAKPTTDYFVCPLSVTSLSEKLVPAVILNLQKRSALDFARRDVNDKEIQIR